MFGQKHYTYTHTHAGSRLLKGEHPWKRRRAMHPRSPIHSHYLWASSLYGSSVRPTRRLFFSSPAHLPQSAQWRIIPAGLLRVLCLQMARRCWWRSLVYWRLRMDEEGEREGGSGVLQSVSNSNTIWTEMPGRNVRNGRASAMETKTKGSWHSENS